ncbi:MAG: methylenetetrahydrofolate reductase [Clostridia bacterium]|nr:methylenetetrahydrofolate reductase [Clostridia bacterium]
MFISDIFKNKKPISFEIFPPKGELSLESFRETMIPLAKLSPDYISVTCSAGGTGHRDRTAMLAGIIKNEFGIEACAHLTCINSDEKRIIEDVECIKANGIENILALRGDISPGGVPGEFRHASDLMKFIDDDELCLGGACYPEGHVESQKPDDDLIHLYGKQQAGAKFLVTQLFFENERFYRFLEKIRKAGITIPVTTGVMPILGKSQISRMIFMCGASLPSEIIRILNRYENDPDSLCKAGIDYAARQIEDLLKNGADGAHIYTMNRPEIATSILEYLK